MGFLKEGFKRLMSNDDDDREFINLVRANDNGEKWAMNKIDVLWNNDESMLAPKIERARAIIYRDAAMAGDRTAILRYARGLEWCGRKDEALQWYMKLINQGDTDAMLALSWDYTEYGGMGRNDKEEIKWIFKAANAGNASAQVKAGQKMRAIGNYFDAVEWFRKSAEQGYVDGKLYYAVCLHREMDALSDYYRGLPVPKEYEYVLTCRIRSKKDCPEVLKELYRKLDLLYIDVLNKSKNEIDIREAFNGLSRMYLFPPEATFSPNPYRGVYYKYREAYEFDDENAYQMCRELIQMFNLRITKEDLIAWEQEPFEIWLKKRNG